VLIQDGAPQEAAADLRQALKLKHGLDGGQLRNADRWLTDLVAGGSDSAPVTRVALAEAAPPAATPPPPSPAASPKASAPPHDAGAAINGNMPDIARPPTADKRPDAVKKPLPGAVAKPAPPAIETPLPSSPSVTRLEGAERRSLPLTGAALDKLKPTVDQMFSPSKEARLAATTSLIVDADTTSDAVPLGVQRALQAQRNGAAKDPAELAGVINVLTLLHSATPSTLALARARSARCSTPRAERPADRGAGPSACGRARPRQQLPLVYIQIAAESQRALANVLAARLRGAAYRAPAAEVVGAARRRAQRSACRAAATRASGALDGKGDRGDHRHAGRREDAAQREAEGRHVEIWLDAAVRGAGSQAGGVRHDLHSSSTMPA
jgi:hypothetical protein